MRGSELASKVSIKRVPQRKARRVKVKDHTTITTKLDCQNQLSVPSEKMGTDQAKKENSLELKPKLEMNLCLFDDKNGLDSQRQRLLRRSDIESDDAVQTEALTESGDNFSTSKKLIAQ